MFKFIFILFFSLLCTHASSTKPSINFAPLPMVKSQKLLEQYMPMLEYLEKQLNLNFNIIYATHYDDIITQLGQGKIDIAFLGPLPYVEASSRYPQIKPLVRFLDAKGDDRYTCSLFKLKNTTHSYPITNKHFALTQKYSTCGYLATQTLLLERNSSLEKNDFNFVGSHTNALLNVVLGKSDFGCAKTTIVDRYSHFDIQTIAQSAYFPSFLLVYQTKHLSFKTVQMIKDALLQLHPLENKTDANVTKKWGKNLRYGVIEAHERDYDAIREILKTMELPK